LASRLSDLIVQAAAEGAIDFSEMEIGSVRWRSKLRKILAYLQNKNHRECLLVKHGTTSSYIAGHMAGGSLTQNTFQSLKEIASLLSEEIESSYYPSISEPQKVSRKEIAEATKLWENRFGSLDDPEVQRKIQELSAQLASFTSQGPTNLPIGGRLFK
jgi:hypothetical protein